MEDLDGDYLSVDHQTFEQGRYDIVVKFGRIVSLSDSGTSRYVRVDQATPNSVQCDPDDITIVVTDQLAHNLWDYRSE
jgi:sugar lactone lactonase YvrE